MTIDFILDQYWYINLTAVCIGYGLIFLGVKRNSYLLAFVGCFFLIGRVQ